MVLSARAPFDYSLQSPDNREFLRDAATVFEGRPQSAVEVVKAGETLAAVKARLLHGQFLRWCRTESAWHHFAITRYISSHFFFGEFQIAQIVQFDRSALYFLSRQRVTDAARLTAIDEAKQRRRITFQRARAIAGNFDSGLKPHDIEPESAATTNVPPLVAIFDRYDSVYLSKSVDTGTGDVSLWGQAHNSATGERVAVAREDPELLLQAMGGVEPKRVCTKCGAERGIGEFAEITGVPGRRAAACRVCERERSKSNAKKKRNAERN